MRRLLVVPVLLAIAAGAQATLQLAAGAGSVAGGTLGVSGGSWPAASATLMLNRELGINADFAPRGHGSLGPYGYYNTWLADINAAYRPIQARWEPELDVGWGLADTDARLFCPAAPSPSSAIGCNSVGGVKSGIHIGLAFTAFVSQRIFLRPVYHLYLGSGLGHPNYIGLMVGYTFGGR